MTETFHYTSARALRQALEARLLQKSRAENVDLQRLRRQVAFDRLLARLFENTSVPWALKGGYAMELRFQLARATRDVDLTLHRRPAGGPVARKQYILDLLQSAGVVDLNDGFIFLIGESIMDLEGAPDGGARYPIEARMDDRTFTRFHLDVGIGDASVGSTEGLSGHDWLGFAGIAAGVFQSISQEQQFAEKYHAYSLPREGRPNSRVRDLIDMLLLIRFGHLVLARVTEALTQTFERRYSHSIPVNVPLPPPHWAVPFSVMAKDCELSDDLVTAYETLVEFMQRLGR